MKPRVPTRSPDLNIFYTIRLMRIVSLSTAIKNGLRRPYKDDWYFSTKTHRNQISGIFAAIWLAVCNDRN